MSNCTRGHLAFVAFAVVATAAALAADAPTAEDAWVRATPPNATTAAAYLTLRGADEDDRLIGAHSPAAQAVEIHTTLQRDGMMQMIPLKSLAVPARGTVKLSPGGEHLMLIGLEGPLAPGDASLVITLQFERAGAIDVEFPILDARESHTGHPHAGTP